MGNVVRRYTNSEVKARIISTRVWFVIWADGEGFGSSATARDRPNNRQLSAAER